MRRVIAILFGIVLALPAVAQTGYRVRPGDVLRIEVIEDAGLNRSILVAPDGRISLPLAGVVPVGGRTLEEIQATLARELAPNFAAPPNVTVTLERLAERQPPRVVEPIAIHVMGEVARPGRLAVAPGTTLLQAFAEMGGFSRFAAVRRIQLRRRDAGGTERIHTVDYDAILRGESALGTTVLAEGDVIIVPQRRLFE